MRSVQCSEECEPFTHHTLKILRIACNVNVYLIPTIHDSFCGNHKYKPNLLRRLSCAHLRALRCGSIYHLANHIPWTHHWTYCATAPPPGSTPGYTVLQPLPLDPLLDILYYSPSPWIHPWIYCTTATPPESTPGYTVLQPLPLDPPLDILCYSPSPWIHPWTYCGTAPPPGSTPGHTVVQPLPLDPPLDVLCYSPSPWIPSLDILCYSPSPWIHPLLCYRKYITSTKR